MRIPSTIIFPMPDRVVALQQLWRANGLCEDDLSLERYTDEVIDGVVGCLDRYNVSESALMTLAMNSKHMDIYHGRDQAFAAQNAQEIHKLGEDFLRLFTDHMLYMNGKFDYVYSGRCSNKEIILVRYN
jgi:hypothetical protein